MKKTTIVHVTTGLTFGGFETFLYNYFTHLDRSRYNLYIISHEPPNPKCKEKFKKLGFTIYSVPPKKDSFFKNIQAINKIYKTIKPDIVHAHLTESNYIALFLAKINRIKVRISHAHVSRPSKSAYQRISCYLTNIFLTHRLACGDTAAKYLYGKRETIIVPNAFEIKKFRYNETQRDQTRRQLKIKKSTKVYGHVGRFSPEKNQEFIVSIFFKILKTQPDSKLLLIGDGITKSKIKKQISGLKINYSTIIIDANDDIAKYYQAMDFFIFPSFFEGLGSALIEAQTSGLPSIISDIIPRESDITQNITRLNLNLTDQDWANIILEIPKNNNRRRVTEALLKYDINQASKILEKIYGEDNNVSKNIL